MQRTLTSDIVLASALVFSLCAAEVESLSSPPPSSTRCAAARRWMAIAAPTGCGPAGRRTRTALRVARSYGRVRRTRHSRQSAPGPRRDSRFLPCPGVRQRCSRYRPRGRLRRAPLLARDRRTGRRRERAGVERSPHRWWGGLAYSRGAGAVPDNFRYAYVGAAFIVLAMLPPLPLELRPSQLVRGWRPLRCCRPSQQSRSSTEVRSSRLPTCSAGSDVTLVVRRRSPTWVRACSPTSKPCR